MKLDLKPASEYPIGELAGFFTDSFKDYFVPVHINTQALMEIVRRDSVDLSVSKVLLLDEKAVGIALIARRGWENRVAAMGIIPEMRGKGAGSWLMERLADEAKERYTRKLCLEVIEINLPAIHIYEKQGFQKFRKLVGFTGRMESNSSGSELEEVNLRELGKIVNSHGLADLPWQISGETLAVFSNPSLAFKLGPAYAAISNPEAEHVVIWTLLVMPEARKQGLAVEMLRTLSSKFNDKVWHVPPLCPEEASHPFRRLGMKEEKIAQLQMSLSLV
jgi:ribosomal protein S18 acetylase RimI-like enzyme